LEKNETHSLEVTHHKVGEITFSSLVVLVIMIITIARYVGIQLRHTGVNTLVERESQRNVSIEFLIILLHQEQRKGGCQGRDV